ncbi:MAG: DUF2065 domain-containing protein [Gammaproteobacteria bacterium]|nr:DUF2065 domain-containing protein [Gammaproteobacteria bacterium]
MDSTTWWLALALLLIAEGVGPLLFPERWRQMMRLLQAQPDQLLRQIGVALVSVGLLLLWLLLQQNG